MKIRHTSLLQGKHALLLALLISCATTEENVVVLPPSAPGSVAKATVPPVPPSIGAADAPSIKPTRNALTCEDRFETLPAAQRTFPTQSTSALSVPSRTESAAFSIPERIGNGRQAIDGEQSGIVHIASAAGNCTGTYIGNGWVATAAHCGFLAASRTDPTLVRGMKTVKVYFDGLKRNNGTGRSGTMYCHSGFLPKTLHHDIALIQLDSVPPNTPPILLIQPDDVPQATKGAEITVFGFGPEGHVPSGNPQMAGEDVGSGILRQGTLSITRTGSACHTGAVEGSIYCGRTATLSGTPNAGLCKGDSGGPAFLNIAGSRKLAGINSFMTGGNCGGQNVLSGFVSVAYYRNWIRQVAKLD